MNEVIYVFKKGEGWVVESDEDRYLEWFTEELSRKITEALQMPPQYLGLRMREWTWEDVFGR